MNAGSIFGPGASVRAVSAGLTYRVEELLGGGAQGEVYRACAAGAPLALKWYLPSAATSRQLALIQNLISKGPPDNRFLWPIDLASASGAAGFGYFMPLRDLRFRGLTELMTRRIDPTFRALTTAGFELANSFLQLHSKGFCYRDISFGNLFIDPNTGEIRICDNDNVSVDGELSVGVLGTPRFMAPEVVMGKAHPSTQTDLFSLAVLLFYLFLIHHPLEGAKEVAIHSFDLPAMNRLYGSEPLFIFDPCDSSNAPVPGFHDNALATWPIYPRFLRDLFTQAFTAGISDPAHGRVRESEWRAAMIRLRDSIVYCEHCQAENFYDRDVAAGTSGAICWNCQRRYRLPYRIRIGRHVVVLNRDTRLYPHHIDEQRLYDFSKPVAEVRRHPTDPGHWGLLNLSDENWTVRTVNAPAGIPAGPGRTAGLAHGARILFGVSEGEIRG